MLTLGDYLRQLREERGLTIEEVEAITPEGYFSPIEDLWNLEQVIAPNVVNAPMRKLHMLSLIYGVDYIDLLERAGHVRRKG